MKRALAILLLLSLLLALGGCGDGALNDMFDEPAAASATEDPGTPPYDGDLPAILFGVFDEETYANTAFGVRYLRDGRWSFYTMQELANLNGSVGDSSSNILRSTGFIYDMYARSDLETLGFAIAIPSVQFGRAMTEAEYAQAVKEASARNYAGADYDVVSDEIGEISFGGEEHACFYLTVAASGMVFYTAQIFLERDDFIGVVYVSARSEEGRTSLLNSFSGT